MRRTWTGTLITGCQSSIHLYPSGTNLLENTYVHTHTTVESFMYIINHVNDCQVSCLQWAGDKKKLRKPRGHFPLSSAASLLTWSQSQGVMELEKVINPALQQGQDSSIKQVHKDSSIFNYCLQSTEESQKKQPCCDGFRGPQIPAALIIYSRSLQSVGLTPSLSCWWIRSVYLYDITLQGGHVPLRKWGLSAGG